MSLNLRLPVDQNKDVIKISEKAFFSERLEKDLQLAAFFNYNVPKGKWNGQ